MVKAMKSLDAANPLKGLAEAGRAAEKSGGKKGLRSEERRVGKEC